MIGSNACLAASARTMPGERCLQWGGARIHNVRLLWRTAVPDAAVVRPGWSRCLPLPGFRALGRGYAIIGTGPE